MTKSLTENVPLICVMYYLTTNGCRTANIVANGNHGCEMTSGLDNLQEVVEGNSSQVYAVGEFCDILHH